jgi:hypothetical protein
MYRSLSTTTTRRRKRERSIHSDVIATHGGDFSKYVPAPVVAAIHRKLKTRA